MARPLNFGDGIDGLKIWKADCIFPVSGRVPRRGRLGGQAVSSQRNAGLLGRLRHLEAIVSELGSQVEVAVSAPIGEDRDDNGTTSSSYSTRGSQASSAYSQVHDHEANVSKNSNASASEVDCEQPVPSIVIGSLMTQDNGDIIVEDRFWTIFCSEVEQIFDAVRDHSRPPFFSQHGPEERAHLSYFSYLLGRASPDNTTAQIELYPMPSQLPFIWQTFEERIDPFIKVLHRPSMLELIRSQTGDWSTLETGLGALILAVSFAVITVFKDDEVMRSFGQSKSQLQARYRLGVEQAFQQCGLLTTKDLRIVQAYVIYLNALQHSGEVESAWPLVGVLVRIAVRLQLHQEPGAFPGLGHFEIEMRRRLWWNICLLDTHSGGAQRCSPFLISQGMFTTHKPSNVDDAAVGLESGNLIEDNKASTDLTTTLTRIEVWTALQQFRSLTSEPTSLESLESLIQHASGFSQMYTERISASQKPLEQYTATMARLSFARIEFFLRQRAGAVDMQCAETIQAAVLILHDSFALHHEASWKRWRWLLSRYSTPWIALTVLLKHICKQGNRGDLSTAWSAVQNTFAAISEEDKSKPQYGPLLRLVGAAQAVAGARLPATMDHQFVVVPPAETEALPTVDMREFLAPEADSTHSLDEMDIPSLEHMAAGGEDLTEWQQWGFGDWADF
ncbi:hypothetical protein Micbo1qcDRAFT_197540 [Microdochium bolleyi]|uniref:Xylanolytic transcriptional activator regulatory domain-containing protein n=1 Tax=Microdochium bolleyi TaxID=196109 RepID=A0A136ITS0_9PEZI|nr:hypothetical protein Micbo1qcDRAFT_197540 [Microdochium bolleyi]